MFNMGERSKSKHKFGGKSAKLTRYENILQILKLKMKPCLVCKFRLDFRKILCFISKNTMSKVILKYQVSMLTCPSVHPAYLKIHFRITRTVNPLSVSICHCHRASFMKSLFFAFKNSEWCHFVVHIGSLALI